MFGRILSKTDANGNITKKFYDKMGNLTSVYTPNSIINDNMDGEGYQYEYDYMDRLISVKNPLGNIEKSIRDSQGNIIKEINPNYYDSKNQIGVEYVYDKDNRRIKTIYPDGGIQRLFYDANGNVIKHISLEYYNAETDDRINIKGNKDHGGHLITTIFDGSRLVDNIVAMNGNVSAYKKLENMWAEAVSSKKKVIVEISPKYKGNSKRPNSFKVKYSIKGVENKTTIKNIRGGK